MEFHVSRKMRDLCRFDGSLFSYTGNVILSNAKNVRLFAQKINDTIDPVVHPEKMIKAGQLNAMGLIDEIFHHVCAVYRSRVQPDVFKNLAVRLQQKIGAEPFEELIVSFMVEFPPLAVYRNEMSIDEYLAGSENGASNRDAVLEELLMLYLANENPAFKPFGMLFDDSNLKRDKNYTRVRTELSSFFAEQPFFGPNMTDLVTMLKEPVVFSPDSLKGQLDYIRQHWNVLLGEWIMRMLTGADMIAEEEKPGWSPHFSGPPPMEAYNYDAVSHEYERFSPDRDWMPRVVLMAKTVLVWLYQLSKKYNRPIHTLDQIPDEELDILAQQGFTGLWLIGLWERSWASKRIKQICGNPEAAASAYSLHDYEIAKNLGGWDALENLRKRLWFRGIRLASDMVPNHTGMDSNWVVEKPDMFIQTRDCPFPTYTFNGENLSLDPRVTIQAEDHYYSKSDCAVVFKRIDNFTGDTRYIYHGNDGTGMPWNDTAQIDFLNPQAREEVIQKILHVARNFPIIRFDAAMVLAKKHIKRLWYPEPGQGGDIATRAEYALGHAEFERRIPEEFWREVVDRCAQELPDTLLLAEAFWMMEGYFVRTLGMHRVYNSAFMNMLKREENEKYRMTIKNTLEFDPQVLKRFVNFMNNPDEETAEAQFGRGDKYFGVCTMMVTMPGLPMFGHGQIEGFTEKYGMEYTRAYRDETPDQVLHDRHLRDIFPLMKKRYLFAEIENFFFFDVWNDGAVNENIFAYSNSYKTEHAVILYNNVYSQAAGWIKNSCRYAVNDESGSTFHTKPFAQALNLNNEDGYYCIFQEQKSGLWYIRKNIDIWKNGLFIQLNGFECQVLLNISQLHDDETGKYGVLCETLNGRGVHDIDTALKEIFLKDLYKALSDFADTGIISGTAEICVPKAKAKQKKISAVLSDAQEAGIAYFEMLVRFIEGNYGYSSVINAETAGSRITAELAWTRFSDRIKRLVLLSTTARKAAVFRERGIDIKQSVLIEEMVYQGIFGRPFMAEILTAYTMLYSVRDMIGENASADDAKEVINLWCMDRKMRDILVAQGIPSRDLFAIFKTLLEVTKFCDYPLVDKNPKISAYLVVRTLSEAAAAPAVLGVNNYGGTIWFNKELFETAVWAAGALYTLYHEKGYKSSTMITIQTILSQASAESGFMVENLLKTLEPDPAELKKILKKFAADGSGKKTELSVTDGSAKKVQDPAENGDINSKKTKKVASDNDLKKGLGSKKK